MTEPKELVLRSDERMFVMAKLEVVAFVVRSVGNVDVAVVVAVKYAATASPTTDNFACGEGVPMPTLPVDVIPIRATPLVVNTRPDANPPTEELNKIVDSFVPPGAYTPATYIP